MNTENHTPILHRNLLPKKRKAGKEPTLHDDILNSTINCIGKETEDSIAQPHLFIGAPGSGKTHLLRRIESRIRKGYGQLLQPIFIEGRMLFSTDDIWRQGAAQLNIYASSSSYTDVIEWQKGHSCRLVLLIDNIRYYFERTSNTDHFELRGKLNKSGAPIIIATSDRMLPAFASYDAAFFDAFKTSYIRPLSTQEINALIGGRADTERVGKLMDYLPKTPRSVFTAVDAVEKSNDPEMDLVFLTDFFSDLYQNKYNELPTQIQKILSTLAQAGEGLNLREIREESGQDNGKLSPYLKIMLDRSLVEKIAQSPRDGIYKISDPLFGLWLKMNGLSAE